MRKAVGLMDGTALMVIGVSSVIPRQKRQLLEKSCFLPEAPGGLMYTMDLMSETWSVCLQVRGLSTWDTGVKIVFSVIFVGNFMLLVDWREFLLLSPQIMGDGRNL